VAGRGSGKTRIGAQDVVMRAQAGEPWMSVSPSYPIIHETTMPTLVEVARELGVFVRAVKSPLPRVTFRTSDGGLANIVFRSGEDPEKLRGPSKAGLWIDEASITKPEVFTVGMAVLRYRGVMGPLILTFTPKGRRHWSFEVFYERIDDSTPGYWERGNNGDGDFFVKVDPETGESKRMPVVYFAGIAYGVRDNAFLVHAHTLENPFLPAEFYDNIRAHYTSHLAAQELGGEFVEIQGIMFKREWFNFVEEVPVDAMRVRYWDRAGTEGAGKYSVGLLMARDKLGRSYVEDIVRGQWSYHTRNKMMLETAKRDCDKYGNTVMIYAEQEGGSGGKEQAQQSIVSLARFPVYSDVVSGVRWKMKDKMRLPGEGKIIRAQPMAAQAEAGNVYIKRANWMEDYLEEICSFPEYAFADQVDASSGAYNKLADMGGVVPAAPRRTAVDAAEARTKKRFGHRLQQSQSQRGD
jgi:predicted phage terminase large subunit-like protein